MPDGTTLDTPASVPAVEGRSDRRHRARTLRTSRHLMGALHDLAGHPRPMVVGAGGGTTTTARPRRRTPWRLLRVRITLGLTTEADHGKFGPPIMWSASQSGLRGPAVRVGGGSSGRARP
jgi:hypothetical protein